MRPLAGVHKSSEAGKAGLSWGSPIGIDWSVRHVSGQVCISNVLRYDTTDEAEPVRFPDLTIEVSADAYRHQVAAFAKKAKEPFEGVEKTYFNDSDREDYQKFWDEYDQILSRAEA